MAEADQSASDQDQCRALTEDGDRCERPAREDGFCYQHGPEDETVDDANETDDEEADEETDEESADEEESDETDADEESEEESDAGSGDGEVAPTEIGEVRDKIRGVAEDLIGRPLVSVVAVDREDGTWRAAVEVIERKSVPDTQDILGRYEITLDEDHTITGYRRTHRYRRDDMDQDV